MEIKKTNTGIYVYENGLNIGYSNEQDTFIVRGRHVSKEEFNKAFPTKKETKQNKK